MSYTSEVKSTDGVFPRGIGSTILPTDKLRIAYRRYKTKTPVPDGVTKINFIFAHGTGMNKSVWKYHIDQLYRLSQGSKEWQVDSVVSVDAAGHGDSALLNEGKIGWSCDWRDGGKDLVNVVKHEIEQTGDFVPSATVRNVLVGHSMGGYMVAYAGFLEPSLFDSVVSIEPVLFYDEMFTEFFVHRMKKLGKMLKDEFPSEDAAKQFYDKSFYNVLDKRVLADFVGDELYTENGKVKTKSKVPAQLATYMSALYCVYPGQQALKNMEIPFLHVVGTEAMWNPPDAVEYIRSAVPPQFIEAAELEGDHLVHGTKVDETVQLIRGFVDRRVAFVRDHHGKFPEVKHKNDRNAIFEDQWKHMLEGDIENAVYFATPRPKL